MYKMAKVERASAAGQILEQLKQRFICWRESRKQGERIPQALWSAAVGETKQHGVYQVARTLRLDYTYLKRLVGPSGRAKSPAKIDTQFVELFAAPPAKASSVCECIVELENVRGAKMRVELNAGGLAGLASLCSSFWSAR